MERDKLTIGGMKDMILPQSLQTLKVYSGKLILKQTNKQNTNNHNSVKIK